MYLSLLMSLLRTFSTGWTVFCTQLYFHDPISCEKETGENRYSHLFLHQRDEVARESNAIFSPCLLQRKPITVSPTYSWCRCSIRGM